VIDAEMCVAAEENPSDVAGPRFELMSKISKIKNIFIFIFFLFFGWMGTLLGAW
jgi:hypothetical protein